MIQYPLCNSQKSYVDVGILSCARRREAGVFKLKWENQTLFVKCRLELTVTTRFSNLKQRPQ